MRWCLAFFSLVFLATTTNSCLISHYFYIRNAGGVGLVLDYAQEQVTFEFYTGSTSQQWRVECSETPGLFFIMNINKFGMYLAVDPDSNTKRVILANHDLNSLYQQWSINSDGSIVNAAVDLALEPEDGTASPEGLLNVGQLITDQNGTLDDEQKFILQQKS